MGPVSGTAAFMGGAALGLIGVEAPTLALVLGWIAILIELVGGFVFMIGCCKTSKYAAVALAVVAGVIMILDIQKGMAGGFFKALMGAQFTILFFTVFAQSAWKTVASCCGMGCGSCCGTEMKK